MNVTPAIPGPQVKCRTCFALIDVDAQRCPRCRAPQDWRRHVTPVNVLGLVMVSAIVITIFFGVRWMERATTPPQATLRTNFSSKGLDFSATITIANPDPRQLLVRMVMVDVLNGKGEKVSFVFDEEAPGAPFTVEAGQVGTRTFSLGKGPGFIINPVTRAVLYHFDGRTEQLVDSSSSLLGNDMVIPPFVKEKMGN